MKTANRIAKNTLILYSKMIITMFISLYVTRLVLNSLGIEGLGVFTVLASSVLLMTFLNPPMITASQRFISYAQGKGDLHEQKSLFNISLIVHLSIGIITIIILLSLSSYLFEDILNISEKFIGEAKTVYYYLAIGAFFTILTIPYDAVINAHENMLLVAIIGVIEVLLKLGIALFITFVADDKFLVYGTLMALLMVVVSLMKIIYCHIKYYELDINFYKYFDKKLFKKFVKFSGWTFLGSSSSFGANYGQGIMLNSFFGSSINSAQGIASQLNGQLSSVTNIMIVALTPTLAKSEGANNRQLMIKASIMGSKMSLYLSMLLFIPVLIEIDYILKVWLINVPEYTSIFLTLLLIRTLVEQVFRTLASSIVAHGNIKNYQIVSAFLTILPLLASYILFSNGFPPYYMYGTFVIYAVTMSCVILYYAHKNFSFPFVLFTKDTLLRCVLVFSLSFFVALVPSHFITEGFFRLLLTLSTSFFISILAIYFLGFNRNEKIDVINFLKQFKTKLTLKKSKKGVL